KASDKRFHELVARALTFQMLLPCGVAVGGTLWMVEYFQIWRNEFAEKFIMVVIRQCLSTAVIATLSSRAAYFPSLLFMNFSSFLHIAPFFILGEI
ncbi:hypothetical protein PRIPAC_91465, partial [Pristionchus pacificus]|uniref:Uncharacterized protein n=1 Tax=Pristionchus pacificus TaxID=54126 RepID=A0A2A6CGI5_PRIPA